MKRSTFIGAIMAIISLVILVLVTKMSLVVPPQKEGARRVHRRAIGLGRGRHGPPWRRAVTGRAGDRRPGQTTRRARPTPTATAPPKITATPEVVPGLEALRQKRYSKAVADLKTAIEGDPRNLALHLGLAEALTKLGRLDEALPHFLTVLRERPDDGRQFEALAGEAVERLGMAREPLSGVHHRACAASVTKFAPRRPLATSAPAAKAPLPFVCTYARALEKLARREEIQDDYRSLDRRHFTLRYAAGTAAEAPTLALAALKSAYREIGQDLGAFPDEPIPVVVYDQLDFQRLTGAAHLIAGLWDETTIRIPSNSAARSVDHLAAVLRHEYTHALLSHLAGRRVPRWLHEGLAQYEEGKTPMDRPAAIRRRSWGLPPDHPWFGFDPINLAHPQAIDQLYFQSLAVVRYLLDRYRKADMQRLIRRLAQGDEVDEALERVYLRSQKDLFAKAREACCS